jgi:hypothetical protein
MELPKYNTATEYKACQTLRQIVRNFVESTAEAGFSVEDIKQHLIQQGVPEFIVIEHRSKRMGKGQECIAEHVATKGLAAISRLVSFSRESNLWFLRAFNKDVSKLREEFLTSHCTRAATSGYKGYAISSETQQLIRAKMLSGKTFKSSELKKFALQIGIPVSVTQRGTDGKLANNLIAQSYIQRVIQLAKAKGLIESVRLGVWKVVGK